jgi:Na+/alanine symporter
MKKKLIPLIAVLSFLTTLLMYITTITSIPSSIILLENEAFKTKQLIGVNYSEAKTSTNAILTSYNETEKLSNTKKEI